MAVAMRVGMKVATQVASASAMLRHVRMKRVGALLFGL